MLKLYNKEHVAISALTNLKDYKIEYLLSGEDLLEFSLSICDENIHLVEEEGYVQNKDNEYVIKAIDPSQNYKRFTCNINVESIKGKALPKFDTSNQTVDDTVRLAIAGTGWILVDTGIKKRRTVRAKNTNALEILRLVRKAFTVDIRYDAINKKIYIYEKFGSDKGAYFSDELNLKALNIPSNTHDYCTRLYCYGKDGLNISSINGGKQYIENFQYSNKIIEDIWEDNRYTIVQNLKEDAERKLEELSRPDRTYEVEAVDMAKCSDEYAFLDFFLGDTITLLSKSKRFKDKQRIIKHIEFPNDSMKNSCVLGNTNLSFEDFRQEEEYANSVIDNITSDNGTVDGTTIDSIETNQIKNFDSEVIRVSNIEATNMKVTNIEAHNVTITGELNAVKINVGTLTTNMGTIDKLTVTHTAYITDLQANKASITQLNAVNATIQIVEAEVGKIQTLVNGNLSSENIQTGGITSDRLTIANGFIKNAMVDSLDVSKVNAGDISTNKFRIKSDDGGIEIVGATQQFKDKNNKVRIQMGKDTQGNFNFIIRGEDGTTTLIDHTGVKASAIANDLIKENMIAEDAIGDKQINYSKFIEGFNEDTNTTTLKSTKIKLDNQNQTLDIAFNQLKTQSDGTKTTTESNTTQLSVHQGRIESLVASTTIIKDGQTTTLKDDYNHTVTTVNSISSTIGSHTTQIDDATGKITGVETKVNTVERDLNSITARVSSTESTTTKLNADVDKAQKDATGANSKIDNVYAEITTTKNKVADIEINLSSITSRVSSVETTSANINGQVSNLSTRMSSAEQKITDASIITTVNSQFYTKNQTDSMYASQAQLRQTEDKFEFEISKTGTPQLIANGDLRNQMKFWYTWNSNKVLEHNDGYNLHVSPDKTSGKVGFGIKLPAFDVVAGMTYTVAFWVESTKIKELNYCFLMQSDTGFQRIGNVSFSTSGGIMTRVSITFTSQYTRNAFIMLGWEGTYISGMYFRIKEACCYEGNRAYPYRGSENELYSGVSFVDMEGMGVKHTDGSISKLTPVELMFTNTAQQKKMAIKKGSLYAYDVNNGDLLGMFASNKVNNSTYRGITTGLTGSSHYYAIGATQELSDNDQLTMTPYIVVAQQDLVNFLGNSRVSAGVNFMNTQCIFHKSPYFMMSPRFKGGMAILDASDRNINFYHANNSMYLESSLTLPTGGSFYGGGLYGSNITSLGYNLNGKYTDVIKLYANIQQIDFLRPLNMNNFGIYNANIVGTVSASYSLAAPPTRTTVGADAMSIETMLLQEDFSEYDELNHAVIVNINEAVKSVYAENKKLENEKEQLKTKNKELSNELIVTKSAIDELLMSVI